MWLRPPSIAGEISPTGHLSQDRLDWGGLFWARSVKSALLKVFRTAAKPVITGVLAAAFLFLPARASAIDYKVSFNQTPYYIFGSFDSNENITYQLSSAIDGSLRA